MTPYEARVAGDRLVAATCEPVPGGVRLRTPDLPDVRDYNGVVLRPGAAVAVDDDVLRVNAFDLPEVPAGWKAMPLLVLRFAGDPPAMPAAVTEVDGALLREARAGVWRTYQMSGRALEQLLEMQTREAAAGRLFAVLRDGRPVAWSQLNAGFIDDVHVQPSLRRRGLGRDVSTAALAAGGRFLSVEPGNEAAVALYRGLGFEDAGTLTQLTRG